MTTLAELLRARRTAILQNWQNTVREDTALQTHVPGLLDGMIAAIERLDDLDETRGAEDLAARFLPPADAGERLAEGHSVASVLAELGHLREKIVDECVGARADLEPRGERFVHAALDQCMSITAVAMEHAEASDRERFVAVLGHDLRTPLNAIKMAGSILVRSDLDSQQEAFAHKIVRAADRMNGMIGDLLDFAALRSGSLTLDRCRCDLRSTCGEVIDELRLAHTERVIQFEAEGECEGTWDGQRMAQVMSNLIANALTYSPPDTPVTVKLQGTGTLVTLAVHNAGDAIPADQQACIYTPFKRGSKRKSGGVGLGLFIAHEMVRAHGGSISLRSEPGDGTTFTVHVPRA
ncbi:MAG TPA: sensor histidine kinase [Polyangiaceae bacterium]|jgi:signal transduction histidine kinase